MAHHRRHVQPLPAAPILHGHLGDCLRHTRLPQAAAVHRHTRVLSVLSVVRHTRIAALAAVQGARGRGAHHHSVGVRVQWSRCARQYRQDSEAAGARAGE